MAGPLPRRILVTGASGFLGRRVLRQLLDTQAVVIATGRHRPEGYSGEFIPADLVSDDVSDAVRRSGATHLLHFAWYTEHGKFWTSPVNLRWADATVRLVEAFCQSGGQRVVVAGTCAEYDWSYGFCREDETPLAPKTLYGASKDATRRLVAALCEDAAVSLAWGRIFIPFGPGEDERRLIPSLIRVFQGKRAPFGVNADALRDFLHVDDVARAFTALLASDRCGAFNVASGEAMRISDLVRLVAEAHGRDARVVLDLASERHGEPPLLIPETLKLRSLGWRPMWRLADCITEASCASWSLSEADTA